MPATLIPMVHEGVAKVYWAQPAQVAYLEMNGWVISGEVPPPPEGTYVTPDELDDALATKQPLDQDLTTIGAIDSTQVGVLASDGAGWTRKSYSQVKSSLSLGKGDVGLAAVDNTADTSKPVSTAQQTALDLKQSLSAKGQANGYASLGNDGRVPVGQLPAYVEEVQEYANLGAFPGTGSTSTIYIALNTNKVYRWGGTVYVEITSTPGNTDAVSEGSTNLYFTTGRAAAAAPVQTVAGRSGTVTLTKADVGLSGVDNTSDANKPVSVATQTALDGKAALSHTHSQYQTESQVVDLIEANGGSGIPTGSEVVYITTGDDANLTAALAAAPAQAILVAVKVAGT